jgi:transcriptional regulator with XRE-family HTH domain
MPRGGPRLRDEQGRVNGLGERVRARRKELGLTQAELCARIETATDGGWLVDRQDILRIENGGRIVGDLEVRCLARVLETRACWLLLGDAPDEPQRWA